MVTQGGEIKTTREAKQKGEEMLLWEGRIAPHLLLLTPNFSPLPAPVTELWKINKR